MTTESPIVAGLATTTPPMASPLSRQSVNNALALVSAFPFPRFPREGSDAHGGGLCVVPFAPSAAAFRPKPVAPLALSSSDAADDSDAPGDKGKAPLSHNPWLMQNKAVSQQGRAYPQALAQNLEAADIGDPDAMFNIGRAFVDAQGGLDRHIGWAVVWLTKAAACDQPQAMVLMGKIYSEGLVRKWENKRKITRIGQTEAESILHDNAIAADWFMRASQAGDFEGMVKLGKCYVWETGVGLKMDPRKAFEWYYLAATRGFSKAQNLLGWCYWKGFGIEKDTMEACRWYRKAAEAGLVEGQANLGLAYCYGWSNGYKDRTEAAHWFWAAAVTGNDAASAYELGLLLEKGSGVQRDAGRAFGWFLCAAEGGVVKGMERVARALVEGNGCRMDKGEGVNWYQRAIEKGSVTSMVNLGVLYTRGEGVAMENGWGVPRNTTTAAKMYISLLPTTTSPDTPHPPPECYYHLAQCYEYGLGIPQDYAKAYIYYEKSYRDHVPSCVGLARFFATGLGGVVARDGKKAFELYEYAMGKGDVVATYHVG
ncbi:hypothetical protein HDU98_006524, partial [Podochytrium sp. JEL0797]